MNNMGGPFPYVEEGEERDESILMFRVAELHFEQRRSNLEIASDLGISRFRVARLLEQAVDLGVVSIKIDYPAAVDAALSDALVEKFTLTGASVLARGTDDSVYDHSVAALAIAHLSGLLNNGDRLGLVWGRTLDFLAQTGSHLLHQLPRVDVIQLIGGVPSSTGGLDASDVVRRFALLTGGRSVVLNAPLVVPTAAVATGLRKERSVAAALEAGRNSDVALFGIGAWDARRSQLWELLDDDARSAAIESGVFADVCGVLISESGEEVEAGLAERVIGIEAASVRKIPRRVGVVLSERGAPAVIAALNSGLITDLVVSASLAKELLASR